MKVLKLQKTSNFMLKVHKSGEAKYMKSRAHVFVAGRVQGVFFRSATKHNADRFNVKGWIRNLSDGRVEAVFEGEKEAVQKLIDFCKHGPSSARVTNIRLTWENYTREFANFKIKYS